MNASGWYCGLGIVDTKIVGGSLGDCAICDLVIHYR